MIAAFHTSGGVIVQVLIGSKSTADATAQSMGLKYADWPGSTDPAVIGALDETHRVVGGVIVEKGA